MAKRVVLELGSSTNFVYSLKPSGRYIPAGFSVPERRGKREERKGGNAETRNGLKLYGTVGKIIGNG